MSPLALIPATPVTFQVGSVVSKAWDALVLALNAKHQRTLGKGQFKSKYTRLMQDCDLYKYLTGLSGVGICPDTSRRSMTMYGSTSCNRSRSRGQNCGHERARVPARYDLLRNHGGTCGTGAQAGTISALTNELCRSDLDDDNASDTGDGGCAVSASDKTTTASAGLAKTSEEPASGRKVPDSHQQRVDKVKRIRGGALSNKLCQLIQPP
ncbi:hypothetical protein PF006_g15734 [Phytophthora fragariae]|uniref:Uncharacterized protein n=1 Tax=Phytophthora fragariae TaxID=53985 RepID=A0A6A3T6N1_9STRA|nr:hypothetical protein PF009_g4073 [Phytophthora fragariae]KAE9130557.1 hypothetical protein PF006_g15734 [Phytophthora fragariae]KAE9328805.1 hypothetical protein PF008_g16081 [Phytophthora fragariae]